MSRSGWYTNVFVYIFTQFAVVSKFYREQLLNIKNQISMLPRDQNKISIAAGELHARCHPNRPRHSPHPCPTRYHPS